MSDNTVIEATVQKSQENKLGEMYEVGEGETRQLTRQLWNGRKANACIGASIISSFEEHCSIVQKITGREKLKWSARGERGRTQEALK